MINNFRDIINRHGLNPETVDGIRNRLARSMGLAFDRVGFTGLQRQAFNTPGFWLSDNEDDRHIIVQGSTSAGKTLISEMAILDTLKNQNKCIVLVPLRAMVRERWQHFREDLALQGTERVYASSSDYQDHDGEIINGEYTVAIIVYEKFFVMLSQSQGKMLDNCGLLVVDELQMLSNSNRGPKLEIAIQKVLRNNALGNEVNTRIMCLTTSDCRVQYIERWLTINQQPPLLIINNDRPTSLLEHVIQLDGLYQAKPIEGEDGIVAEIELYGKNTGEKRSEDGDFLYYEGEIEIPDYVKGLRGEEKKRRLLKALLKEIYKRNPEAKVLIFVNGRQRTKTIAKYIASEDILPQLELTDKLLDIANYDDDDYQQLFARELLPRRLACHNAAISTALREFVEELFGDEDDPLRLVVATETLTIGMNMPVDVMILYDHEIRRTEGSQNLTNQEYKNFVGRAGRLGQKNMRGGRSFIFAADRDECRYFWDTYVNCRPQDIKSSLMKAGAKFQAPFYLNLLNTGRRDDEYSPNDLEALWDESFSRSCDGRKLNVKDVCEELRRARLSSLENHDDDDDDDGGDEKSYRMTDFGKCVTPYAFQLNTCKKINRFFFNGGYIRSKGRWLENIPAGKGGLPFSSTKEDIEPNGYLLDMLYVLCSTNEVVNLGQLRLPSPDINPNESRRAKDIVELTLREMYREGKCRFWEQSPLLQMIEGDYDWKNEQFDKECLMRAIILWHWTQGHRIDRMRRETKFNFVPLVVGDIARLAETVAYQIEAISRMGYRGKESFTHLLPSDLYRLSTRVNYGVPPELVSIANRHVHALERKMILDIGELYKEREFDYTSPMMMLRAPSESDKAEILRIINAEMLDEILKSADDANMHESIEQLIAGIKNDPPAGRPFTDDEKDALENLYYARAFDEDNCLLPWLRNIFSDGSTTEVERFFDADIILDFPIADENLATLQFRGKTFVLIAHTDKPVDARECRHQIERVQGECKVIVLSTETAENMKLNAIRRQYEEMFGELEGVNERLLTTTFNTFIGLITQSIKLTDFHGAMLSALLWDTCGAFHKPLKSFNYLLQNYERRPGSYEGDGGRVRLLCDKKRSSALTELKSILEHNGIAYRELSWGDELIDERKLDEPTLLFLDWRTVQSRWSLDHFCKGLARDNYRKTYAIFESAEEFRAWGGDPSAPCRALEHCETTRNFATDIGINFKALLEQWQDKKYLVGISYAHEEVRENERPAVGLLKKFVELIQEELPEQSILFDTNPSSRNIFHGSGARELTLKKYAQCDYFVVLDDRYYDLSDICREHEAAAIVARIEQLKAPGLDVSQRVWFLNPKGEKHCSLLKAFDGTYTSTLTQRNVKTLAEDFIEMIRERH